jgi:uncharacterized protein (TIGR02145 family)
MKTVKFLFFSVCLGTISFSQTVTIGTQVWMTKNLDVATFRNGDPIPQAKTNEEWQKAAENQQPAWCYYNNDPANGAKYGKLYNWYAVNDSRGLAPEGWHVPSDAEWTSLWKLISQNQIKLKSTSGWNNNGNGTNESGFSGLPGGNRNFDGNFYGIGEVGDLWSSSQSEDSQFGLGFILDSSNAATPPYYPFPKGKGKVVRCVQLELPDF